MVYDELRHISFNNTLTLSFDIPISPFWFDLASEQDKNSKPNNSSDDQSLMKQHLPSGTKSESQKFLLLLNLVVNVLLRYFLPVIPLSAA